MHWVITGANRGIGLAITKKLLQENEEVTVGIRTSMPIEHQNLRALKLEVSDPVSIEEFVVKIDKPIDVLINNAGVLIEERFPEVTEEGMLLSFKVNTLGPYMLVQELYKAGKLRESAKIINISSILGSITNTGGTSSIPYSISKAALNMATKLLSHKLKNMKVISIHPGWVKTDMGGSNAPVLPEESAAGIINVIRNLDKSGIFLDYTGKLIEW
ncbi:MULTISPECIES: SDR family oxidoreductase [Fervidobacterium]|uniref:Short-chain dehydrogenase/reductase SDR n=1 Tax=Fervidobacterium nodosum (strain ATCC 35602 / DSM 5306 / Rt17-B1) TaxID=381764 RepID=A7HM65_FERNB|nr:MULTISPECIES: SDR family oxidoreductase [Fervidobacterium]ABS60998.1 short-chain dehydrogenase/reductase SDR [Fervidobacterium nodosum Rt17-B1]KAF2962324.1 short-chain dehydrogenase [Fervidobacterium sp. 2310opik-2]PHJ14248.1 short-chain dehydrogenase [Fervidobacterium sp. SC_NGM5_G05]